MARLARVRGLAAIALGLSVSLDELAIGFSFGFLRAGRRRPGADWPGLAAAGREDARTG
ncbi:MAG: hypothetical protein ACREPA_05940 [Candidatus Dormibacteraceae bacterium]